MELVRLAPARVHFVFRNAVRVSELSRRQPGIKRVSRWLPRRTIGDCRWMDWREISRLEKEGSTKDMHIERSSALEVSNGTHSRNGTERTPKRLYLRALTSRILDLEIQIQSSADRENT